MDAAVVSRLAQYGAVSAVGGSSLFFLYGHRPDRSVRWPLGLVRTGAGAGGLGVITWLMTQAASLGDGPADAWAPDKVWAVATDTSFGRAALARLGLLLVALVLSLARTQTPPWRTLATLGFAAAASFAWTGHGSADDGVRGYAHLGANVVHLGAAVTWIGALFGLLLLLAQGNRSRSRMGPQAAAPALAAFSRIGPLVVAALVLSGVINGWFLVGFSGLAGLPHTLYGQLLIVKLGLFALMLALAAANRYVLTPRLEHAPAVGAPLRSDRAALISLIIETFLALTVLALVAWLGTLSPTGDT